MKITVKSTLQGYFLFVGGICVEWYTPTEAEAVRRDIDWMKEVNAGQEITVEWLSLSSHDDIGIKI